MTENDNSNLKKDFVDRLHGLSPYVGRLAVHRAKILISQYTTAGNTLLDPFCGSGTIPLEAWKYGLNVFASDLSPYAIALTRAKLFPYQSVELALKRIDKFTALAERERKLVDLRTVPMWVRDFYHPETLRDAIAWACVLRQQKSWFLFGCFLNLLHHQRPGFLSFPASHATPYLRSGKFPKNDFPELYEYRDVRSRLIKKVNRTLSSPIPLNFDIHRNVKSVNAATRKNGFEAIDMIFTSPPYMSGLDYARDNRLRLWFCGVSDWTLLEQDLSPSRKPFSDLMCKCSKRWQENLKQHGHLAIVLGDIHRDKKRIDVAKIVLEAVTSSAPRLRLIACEDQVLPDEKRLIKGNAGTLKETTLIFKKV
ncbi:hypothetical protein H8K35_17330 [Undibacterium sp. LX40W]|uniref:site-specific DNA-methyltransferase (cytosine-N(4)-specific) n=1 Tax=Undibacterium nitidum TaxID=2762298 RepID=A0A923HSH2_9BURK|nr:MULTISPECIES: hypothetical protein [Undibacterium]MBC3883163.1 hypothetical protein [Undibacterium nitidum]MBC3893445.1 hypothetical protein [Undibacterium sp. LX40W]